MVLFKGKEITQEEFDAIMGDMSNFKALSEAYEKKNQTLEDKVKDLDKLSDIQKQLEAKEAKLYEVTLNNRLGKISKYLNTKSKDEKLIKKIGDMSDEDYEFFIDGRTDDVFQTKEEIEFAKADLEKEKTELESNKDKIIKDAAKQHEIDSKKRYDQKLVPDTEIGSSDEDTVADNGFPTIESLEKTFRLRNNPIWEDKTPAMKKRAIDYMDYYGGAELE
jgi:hypothetical protein